MRNRMYGGVRGRKMKVGGKLLHFPPTRFCVNNLFKRNGLLLQEKRPIAHSKEHIFFFGLDEKK